jgi:hypothetical protein
MKHAALLFFAFLMIFSCTEVVFAAPDLSLESIQVTPATPISTGAATLTIVVKNVGTGPHRTVPLFFGGDEKALTAFNIPMHSNGSEHGVAIPPLPAGQSTKFTFTKQSTLPAGTYKIEAKIWPAKPWAVPPSSPEQETNMNNNVMDVTFTIKAATSNLPKDGKILHKIPTGQAPSKPLD